MKLLTELKVKLDWTEKDMFDAIKKAYGIFPDEIERFEVVRESLDARKKPDVVVKLNVAVCVKKQAFKKVSKCNDILVNHDGISVQKVGFDAPRPIVVGFGPAGMFAGLTLALAGLKPIVLEQGKTVYERQKDVDDFWKNKKLNKFSNVQFGEGGAGTFSDGKLASNVSNEYTKACINEMILNGAPKEIFYSFTPHIGSDKLKEVVKNIREKIISLGGEILFNTHFDGFEQNDGKVSKLFAHNVLTNEKKEFETSSIVLAVGHSAVDVYKLLKKSNCVMAQKPFAMGVRIEGLQSDVNFAQYGRNDENLPSANYKLVEHLENGRSVFTFCMCPGGYVVASQSEEGTIVTNGMSLHARDGKNANAALLVNVLPSDFESDDVLAGVEFQHKYEKLAFELAGKSYHAPCEMVKDFLSGNENPSANFGRVLPTYLPSVEVCDLTKCLPDFVSESLKLALPKMNKKIQNFAHDENLLIGVESRSSAPVQIVRDEDFMSNIVGIFPAGEGAGYAGGITSSMADGVKCAEKVIEFLKRQK